MTTKEPRLRKNRHPSMLTLLEMGCRIVFPDGYYLEGQPNTGYIEIGSNMTGTPDSMGVWSLDRTGLNSALNDLQEARREDEEARRY